MSKTKLIYPIVVLIFLITALATSFSLYIYWYLEVSDGLKSVAKRFKLDQQVLLQSDSWVVITVLSILVGFILICIFMIFIYHQKNIRLYRAQHNFINSFTHELKTPVTSLKLYLETFERHALSREDQLKYINYMIHDTNRLSVHISRILDLAKIESQSRDENFTIVNLAQMISDFIETNRHLFQGGEIAVHYPPEARYFYNIDTAMFEMMLMNILTNAIKYNESENPTVDIRLSHVKTSLILSFEDNGIGIAKQNLKRIFKKYFQVGSSDVMSAKGTGIGLYLVQNIIKLHKGRIRVESEGIGRGSVFTVTLPYYSA